MILFRGELGAGQWEAVAPLPEANGGFVAGVAGENLVIAGGTNWREGTKYWLETVHLFSAKTGRWETRGKLPMPIAYAVEGMHQGNVYFLGGSDGTNTHGRLWRIDERGVVAEVARLNKAIVYGGGAVLDGKLYVCGGGTDAADLTQLTGECFAVDLKDGKVESLPMFPGGRMTLPAMAVVRGEILAFTGAVFEKNEVMNRSVAYAYSPKAKQWRQLKDYPFSVRGLAAVALDDRHILLGGGYKSDAEGFTDEALVYDGLENTYRSVGRLPYKAMARLVKVGGYVYWLGGEDEKKHRTNKFYRAEGKGFVKRNE